MVDVLPRIGDVVDDTVLDIVPGSAVLGSAEFTSKGSIVLASVVIVGVVIPVVVGVVVVLALVVVDVAVVVVSAVPHLGHHTSIVFVFKEYYSYILVGCKLLSYVGYSRLPCTGYRIPPATKTKKKVIL